MRAIRTLKEGVLVMMSGAGGGRAEKGGQPELPPMRNPAAAWASGE